MYFHVPGLFLVLYFHLPFQEGATIKRPALSDTLELIARNGIGEFYNGSIAVSIVQEVSTVGMSD